MKKFSGNVNVPALVLSKMTIKNLDVRTGVRAGGINSLSAQQGCGQSAQCNSNPVHSCRPVTH